MTYLIKLFLFTVKNYTSHTTDEIQTLHNRQIQTQPLGIVAHTIQPCLHLQKNAKTKPNTLEFTNNLLSIPSHDYLRLQNAGFDLLVWQNHSPVAVNFVTHVNILPQNGHVLHAGPLAHGGVPTDDAT